MSADNQTPDGVSQAPAVPLSAGAMVGRYRIQRLSGTSALGMTYEAEDVALMRPVVLRIVPREVAVDEARRDLRAVLELQRPEMFRAIETGDFQGLAFIVFSASTEEQKAISEPALSMHSEGVQDAPPTSAGENAASSTPKETPSAARTDAHPASEERPPRYEETSNRSVLERTLELAIPKVTRVLQPMRVLGLLRRPEGVPLAQRLTTGGAGSQSSAKSLLSKLPGVAEPRVLMRVYAPDFEPPSAQKVLHLHRHEDSAVQEFLLRPKRSGGLQVQFELQVGKQVLASQTLRVEVTKSEIPHAPQSLAVSAMTVTIPLKPARRWLLAAAAAALLIAAGYMGWHFRPPKLIPRETLIAEKGPIVDGEAHIAIVAGIGKYPAGFAFGNLSYAEDDARDLGVRLRELGYDVDAFELIGTDAVAASIRSKLKQAANAIKKNTGTILFFFSGHGMQTANGQYLMTYESDVSDPQHTAMPLDEVRTLLDATDARQKIILIDACRSSGAKGGFDFDRLKAYANSSGIRIMNATEKGNPSFEDSKFGHGTFTYEILQALKGGIDNPDGYMTFEDLYSYTRVHMARDSKEGQLPWESSEATGDFILAKASAGQQSPLGTKAPSSPQKTDWSKH